MRTLIIVVIIVIILGAVIFLGKGRSKMPEAHNVPETAGALEDGVYQVSAEESEVLWEGKRPLMAGYVDSGTIGISSGSLTVADGAATAGAVVFDTTTIAASRTGRGDGEGMLTNHLKSADFFDVAVHPTARFEIVSTSNTGEYAYAVRGNLTIKGETATVEFPATAYMSEGKLHIKGTVSVDRTQFGIRYGSGKFFEDLADKVIDDFFVVDLHLIAVKN